MVLGGKQTIQHFGGGGGGLEQAKFGTATFGTTKVCQIISPYLKVRSHFRGVIVSALGIRVLLGMHI